MTKVQIKSEKLTPFGGLFPIMEQFDSTLSSVIDSTLGQRCKSFGYQYSEIIRSLMSIYFCGGSCIEDVTTHLMNHLSLHPTLRTCSSDTILRVLSLCIKAWAICKSSVYIFLISISLIDFFQECARHICCCKCCHVTDYNAHSLLSLPSFHSSNNSLKCSFNDTHHLTYLKIRHA